ncbi:type II toxin-antitoxin system PemK/MazF family toxin [Rhodococcus sp. NPDC058505]|uniref:type II toxin-antitoxin system PemK/MazF family toxin n=1 Tax=unclassified Rhodococcus (in: high G+C Gram-positive bacteria) TaxID=192944 RepID=UPI0036507F4B
MASRWTRIGRQLGDIALREGPRLLKGLQKSGVLPGPRQAGPTPTRPGRPVSATAVPTAHRARTVDYAPDLDGRADPGEIVWTWVSYEEDAGQGKDRPVLVVGRDGRTLLGLMLSSNSERDGQRDWIALGSGSWDGAHRPSWVRLDRVLDVPEDGIRREGAVLDRDRFDRVADRLRRDFGWT